MEGRYSRGILFVLTNCKNPAQEEAFNRWYNETHVPDILKTRLFSTAIRYRSGASSTHTTPARYLAIYETDQQDLESTLKQLRERAAQLRAQGRYDDNLEIVSSTMFRRIGPEFRRGGSGKASGLFFVLSNCSDPARQQEFNVWYDTMHIPDVLGTGLFHTGYRYEGLHPDANLGKFLALYETAGDPGAAAEGLIARYRPRWIETGRWMETLQVVSRGVFAPLRPPA
ncbi:MAG: hypothetical protein HY686_03130 [Chloroflexi bacterium]|nr:hypothetical protein [Chloroflexota bacterium]